MTVQDEPEKDQMSMHAAFASARLHHFGISVADLEETV